jgi:hypothetical protein
MMRHRKSAGHEKPNSRSPERTGRESDADRAKKLESDRLDEALLETFPASDSVSIGRVS